MAGLSEETERFRQRNYDLCMGINLTKLGIVLDELKDDGLSDDEARSAFAVAEGLLHLLRAANTRINKTPKEATNAVTETANG